MCLEPLKKEERVRVRVAETGLPAALAKEEGEEEEEGGDVLAFLDNI